MVETRNTTRAATSSWTFSEAVSPRERGRLARRPAAGTAAFPGRLAQLHGNLEIRLSRQVDLLEVDPLVLGMGLGDVARSRPRKACLSRSRARRWSRTAHRSPRAGVRSRSRSLRGAGRSSRRLGPTSAACVPRVRRTRASRASQAVDRATGATAQCIVRIFTRYQTPVDLHLAPVGNDIDSLPSLDTTDREARGRAPGRESTGTAYRRSSPVLRGRGDPVDGVLTQVRRRAVAGNPAAAIFIRVRPCDSQPGSSRSVRRRSPDRPCGPLGQS